MERARAALPALGLVALCLAAYGNSLGGAFTLDANAVIVAAERVHAATLANALEIVQRDYWWPTNVSGNYRPLTTLSYLFNWAILGNGASPAGYHAVNLALHVACSLLVLAMLRRVASLPGRTAWIGAALFATHPIGVEAVTNVVGRADLLATAFTLTALLLYGEAERARGTARLGRLAGVAIAALLGLLAKESAVALAGLIVLRDVVFAIPPGTSLASSAGILWRRARTAWVALAPPFAIFAAARSWVFGRTAPTVLDVAQNALAVADPWTSRLTALAIAADSGRRLLWPARLCPDYSIGETPLVTGLLGAGGGRALAGAALLALACAAPLCLRSRRPAVAFLAGFALVTYLPTSNLLVAIGTTTADRFLYLPLAALAGLAALAIEGLAGLVACAARSAHVTAPGVACTAAAVLVTACILRTRDRNLDWKDDVTLWSRAVETCPAAFKSHQALAAALAQGDDGSRIDRLIALQETAIDILRRNAPPGTPIPAHVAERAGGFYLRKALLSARDPAASREWARRAEDSLRSATLQYDAENAARRAGREGEIELGTPALWTQLGQARLLLDQPESALAAFEAARLFAPGDPAAHVNVARAKRRLGRDGEALTSVLQALLMAGGDPGLTSMVYDVYQRLEPGGCAFTRTEAGGVRVDPGCAAARLWVCRAYAELLAAFRDAKNTSAAERRATMERFSRAAARDFGCSGLPGPPPG